MKDHQPCQSETTTPHPSRMESLSRHIETREPERHQYGNRENPGPDVDKRTRAHEITPPSPIIGVREVIDRLGYRRLVAHTGMESHSGSFELPK